MIRGDRKYQFMEMNTQRRAAGLRDKIPDIQKTLDTVMFLDSRKVRQSMILSLQLLTWWWGLNQDSSTEIESTFELNDTLFAKAKVTATDEVYLWLGVRSP